MIISDKGVIISFKEVTGIIDPNELAQLRGRNDTKFHVQDKMQDLNYTGMLDKIKLDKNGVALVFNIETKLKDIDLNQIVRMYTDPEPWIVRLSDCQRGLDKIQQKLEAEFRLDQKAKERLQEASEKLKEENKEE